MASFIIEGGHRLSGEIRPQGAKNEALQILCATLLTAEEVTVGNIPDILDVNNLIALLEKMGVKVKKLGKGEYSFKADNPDFDYIRSADFLKRTEALRGSIMLVGPMLGRFGWAITSKPGGDKIGRRRLDTHFEGMKRLGAAFEYDSTNYTYTLKADRLKGTRMLLDEASVTGTANIVMASVLAEGTTTALSFLLGGELLNTIIAPDWHDVGMTCAVLLMRAAMAVLIHWESTHEKHEA